MWGKYFLIIPGVLGNDRVMALVILTPGRLSIAKGRAKSKVFISSLSPGGEAYSSAMKAEKS